MRAILIDPYTETVSEIQIDPNKNLHETIRCGMIDSVRLNRFTYMIVDDEGLVAIKRDEHGNVSTRFFILCHPIDNEPLKFIAGKAVIIGNDNAGEAADVKLDLEQAKASVRFIPAQFGNEAAEIADSLCGLTTFCETQEQVNNIAVQHNAIMDKAMRLTI